MLGKICVKLIMSWINTNNVPEPLEHVLPEQTESSKEYSLEYTGYIHTKPTANVTYTLFIWEILKKLCIFYCIQHRRRTTLFSSPNSQLILTPKMLLNLEDEGSQ